LIALLLSDFAHAGMDGFTATNAIAAAANKSVPALVKRTNEKKRFRLNECGVFMVSWILWEV
jgi:CheY-like chemotaxis protein